MKTNHLVIFLILILSGCRTDFNELEYDEWAPIIALPVVNSTINYNDVFTELNHPEELLLLDDGIIALNFKGELLSFSPSELIQIADISEESMVQLDGIAAVVLDLNSEPITFPVLENIPLDFGSSSITIDEVKFSSGTFTVSLTRFQDEFISSSIEISGLVDSKNQPVIIDFQGNETEGMAETVTIDLTNYKLQPSFSPAYQNQISIAGNLNVENNTNHKAQAGDLVSLSYELINPGFAHVIGDFGNLNLNSDQDTVFLDLFQDVQGGSFQLEESIVSFKIENSFGIPALIDVGEVVSENLNTGVVTPLLLENIELEGQSSLTSASENLTITYDDSNSNVSNLFSSAPVNVIVDISTESNPAGSPPPSDLNFITDSSALKLEVDVILPLQGSLNDVIVVDTLASEFFLENNEDLDSLELRIETVNGFPLECGVQIIFLDSLNTVIDSLFHQERLVISSANTDLEGNVVNSSIAENFIVFKDESVFLLNDTRKIVIRARVNSYESSEGTRVKINDTQELEIKLGAKLFGRVEL